MTNSTNSPNSTNFISLLSLVILLAFGLRLHALTRFQYHIDEFFTLPAANLIAEQGAPRFPTGLLYDPGLPFSYLTGFLFWAVGFNEAVGRWPAVIFGVLAVVTVYWLGRQALASPGVGLLAAFWLAISLESVEWSGRARMITLAQWLVLLSTALLWLGLRRNASRYRLAFAVSNGLTLLTHFSTVVLMPAWFAAAGALVWARAVRLTPGLLRDAAITLAIFGLAIASGIYFQPPPNPDFEIGSTRLGEKTEELGGKFLDIPSDVGHAWEAYGPYFLELPHAPLLLLAAAGLIFTAGRFLRQASRPADTGALFLGSLFIIVMLTLALVIDTHWQRSRYLLMQAQGFFLLLAAHGVKELMGWQARLWARFFGSGVPLRPWANKINWLPPLIVGVLLVIGASLPFWPPLRPLLTAGSGGWERYDLAFGQVRDNLSAGDRVMSMHPPASLLYLNQSDYYLVQSSPKLIERPDGQLGDRYSGALWLDNAAEFNQTLAETGRVWLVTEEFWLFNSYDGYLQQQILWQMDKQWGEGGIWALVSRPGAWPLAYEPDILVNAEFSNGTRLVGYTAAPPTPAPGGIIYLTLFWRSSNLPVGAKVFVHLRDEANHTVAQADHFLYDGKVPISRWSSLSENDPLIRDGASLSLPPDLPAGAYRLLVGFYHPQTFDRLPVVNDQTGENAVILGEWTLE